MAKTSSPWPRACQCALRSRLFLWARRTRRWLACAAGRSAAQRCWFRAREQCSVFSIKLQHRVLKDTEVNQTAHFMQLESQKNLPFIQEMHEPKRQQQSDQRNHHIAHAFGEVLVEKGFHIAARQA